MEQMTSHERITAALHFQPVDRVPISPLYHYATANINGYTVRQYATNPEIMAHCSADAVKRFGFDAAVIGTDVAIEAEALGSEVEQPENSPMHIISSLLNTETDFSTLKTPDPEKDGRLPILLKATELCKKELGKDGFVIACANGPINNAGQFFGITELMYLIIDDPEMFEELLDFSLAVSIRLSVRLLEAGADMILSGEALASPNFINPQLYRDYILPRQIVWANAIRDSGGFSLMHICGKTQSILEDMKGSGFDCIDVDWPVPMSEARKKSGISVRGNINPSKVLVQGNTEDVKMAVKDVMDDAKDSPGLIMGTGCDVSVITPFENLYAFAEASKQYGMY
ncbi:MAG: uroporphyrinogen decarboxylase family protein [Clostridiales Family XIII bacterium]|jgi:uroporphyrinogen decarboxylase|nr:uroporphyrinogen decarboxylase family protein [Clostridiales Family XIII bacterium]